MTKTPTTPKKSNFQPSWAFIAAAGMGSRMRPLTDGRPKPMVEVCGHPILTHIFDHLKAGGIHDIVLNTHYKHSVIEDWLHSGAVDNALSVTAIYEPDLLDTGGGVQSAATRLGRLDEAFVMVNGDAFWVNAPSGSTNQSTLQALCDQWDDTTMDILLLLQPVASMALTGGSGDYAMTQNGGNKEPRPVRLSSKDGDLMFAGVRIVHPRVFEGRSIGKYSFLELMDAAEKKGRLAAHIHKGDWHHLSTPQDVKNVSAALGADWRVGAAHSAPKSSPIPSPQAQKIRVI